MAASDLHQSGDFSKKSLKTWDSGKYLEILAGHSFKRMLFIETNEANIINLYPLFFVIAADKASFGKLLWLHNETGNVNSSI